MVFAEKLIDEDAFGIGPTVPDQSRRSLRDYQSIRQYMAYGAKSVVIAGGYESARRVWI